MNISWKSIIIRSFYFWGTLYWKVNNQIKQITVACVKDFVVENKENWSNVIYVLERENKCI